jgi:hypothetical protein
MTNPIQALRLAEDYANAVDVILGECPYRVFLVEAVDASVDLDTIGNIAPTPSYQRITIADGYRSYLAVAPSDGYMYPQVVEKRTSVLLASQAVFSSKEVYIGPLVLPYVLGTKSGGTDPAIFSPPPNSTNLQYWINITGPGILGGDGLGSYYDIKEVKLDAMNNINYFLVITATASAPANT